MPTVHDDEFGKIVIRKSPRSTRVSMRVAPDGSLRVSAPVYMPLFAVRRMIASSRPALRELVHSQRPPLTYEDGDQVGKSHSIQVREGSIVEVKRQGLRIIVTKPAATPLSDPAVQEALRSQIIEALRREAKGYLPKRLAFLAEEHGFRYAKVRFSHASGRWGSCSSTGTISLNIALMKLPFELIDYVIIHELAHTRYLDHSDDFWETVAQYDPQYRTHRSLLRQESPSIS